MTFGSNQKLLMARAGATLSDPFFSDVSLLLHGDGADGSTTFLDSSNNSFTLTPFGNVQIDTSVVKYGTGSIQFDGTGDYATIPADTAFAFGTGDFTVEGWFNFNSLGAFKHFIDTRVSQTGGWVFFINSSNRIVWFDGSSSYTSSATISNTGTWYHIAITRSGSTLRVFLNGVLASSTTNTTSHAAPAFYLGSRYNLETTGFFDGYMDDIRVTKGVARYTANFTPPDRAFPDQ